MRNLRTHYHHVWRDMTDEQIIEKINQRRRQLVVHSRIYYVDNETLIADHQWDTWARELVALQASHPNLAKKVKYERKFFETFDGSTGYDMPYTNPQVRDLAAWLLDKHGKGMR